MNFVKIVQTSRPWEANLWQKFEILTVLVAVFPHSCPDKREIWHGGADLRSTGGAVRSHVPNFTFIGATCRPCGAKNPFWTTELKQYRYGCDSRWPVGNKRLRWRYCIVEANYRQIWNIARPLCYSRASCFYDCCVFSWCKVRLCNAV